MNCLKGCVRYSKSDLLSLELCKNLCKFILSYFNIFVNTITYKLVIFVYMYVLLFWNDMV